MQQTGLSWGPARTSRQAGQSCHTVSRESCCHVLGHVASLAVLPCTGPRGLLVECVAMLQAMQGCGRSGLSTSAPLALATSLPTS